MNLAMGVTPFFANYGTEMKAIRTELNQQYQNKKAKLTSEKIKQLHK